MLFAHSCFRRFFSMVNTKLTNLPTGAEFKEVPLLRFPDNRRDYNTRTSSSSESMSRLVSVDLMGISRLYVTNRNYDDLRIDRASCAGLISAMQQAGVMVFVGVGLAYLATTIARRERGLPPGPPTVPILGNLHLFPRSEVHVQFQKWAQEWGDIFTLKISSGTMIVISSATAVKEFLDKTGWNASDRPSMFLVDQITDGNHMGFMKYGPRLRTLRKYTNQALSPQAMAKYMPIQEAECSQFLYDLLERPDAFYDATRRFTHSVAKSITYGTRVPHYTSPDALTFFETLHALEHTVSPGTHPPIDILSFLKYIPRRWAPWIRACEDVRQRRDAILWRLYGECEARVGRGEDPRSMVEEMVIHGDALGLDKATVAHLGIIMLEAGTDTSAAYLQSLILILCAFPEVAKVAQAALDSVVGDARLPIVDDLKGVPYIAALIKEVIRYRPMLPIGLPHATVDSDSYKGYVIPRGTTVIANIWAIFHDPELFENPEIFKPERYMNNKFGTKREECGKDLRDTLVFGTGRRICPGMHVAEATMGLATMRLLWAFDFYPELDQVTAQPIKPDLENYSSDITLAPRPFRCRIVPRSSERAHVVRRSFVDATNTLRLFEDGLTENEKQELHLLRKQQAVSFE